METTARENVGLRLHERKYAQKWNNFLYSGWFVASIGLVTIAAHVLEWELCAYALFTLIALGVSFFGRDYLPYIVLLVACYVLPSAENNPGKNDTTVLFSGAGARYLTVFAVLIVLSMCLRFSWNKGEGWKKLFRTKRKLLWGMLALGAAYVMSGLGSEGYASLAWKNIAFGALQFATVFVPYYLLSGSVDWKKADKRYIAYVGLMMGLVVGMEMLNAYRIHDVVQDGKLDRMKIYVGWGINNNIGLLVAMSIPFAFYFAHRGQGVLLANLSAAACFVFCVLSCSRAAILGGGCIYLVCAALVCVKGKTRFAKGITCAFLVLFVGGCLWMVLQEKVVFQTAFQAGLRSDIRLRQYRLGFRIFQKNPMFGSNYYEMGTYAVDENVYWVWSKVPSFVGFFPGRWHNTVVQLLACCGVVGLAAYAYHRYQTLRLVFTKRSTEKTYIALSLAVLLALSLLDCHFFNLGPTLFYSCALACMEYGTENEEEL